MMQKKLHVLRLAGLLFGLATLLTAGDFEAPAEGPIAFRRDKVQLDAETMGDLSRQLGKLAARLDTTTAAGRRTAAQMLALATALDPSNAAARELIVSLQSGSHQPEANPAESEKIHEKIWHSISWLESPEAGVQGKALGACLTDVLAISDPSNPRAQAILAAGERGAWAGWVPPVSAYDPKTIVKTDEPGTGAENTIPQAAEITLTKAEVRTSIWQRAKDEIPAAPGSQEPPKWFLASAPLRMTAEKTTEESDDPEGFSVIISAAPDGGSLEQLGISIKSLLKKQHGQLPAGWNVLITSDELQKSALSGNRQSISAASAVLASAAITGREPDATILGLIDEQGAFKLPSGFWNQLDSLGKGNGGRLVLPVAASEYLPSVLALEKPQFFFDYEVVLATNFQELLDLSAKVPNEAIAKASAKFQEIRLKAGSQPVGQYVANPFIRRRLAELTQEAPLHFSARLLATQGAGNRPTQIPRAVLLPELRRAIEPMAWLVGPLDPFIAPLDNAKIDRITQTFEACRSQVDRLERYVAKEDRGLLDQAKEMVAGIRTLERAARSRGETYVVLQAVISARVLLLNAYEEMTEALGESAGEAHPVTVPPP